MSLLTREMFNAGLVSTYNVATVTIKTLGGWVRIDNVALYGDSDGDVDLDEIDEAFDVADAGQKVAAAIAKAVELEYDVAEVESIDDLSGYRRERGNVGTFQALVDPDPRERILLLQHEVAEGVLLIFGLDANEQTIDSDNLVLFGEEQLQNVELVNADGSEIDPDSIPIAGADLEDGSGAG